jgi:tight adherence protein C
MAVLALAPLLAAAAVRLPELVLARVGKRRQERIAARVPDLVELLVTTTRAGLSPSIAFRRSAQILRGPLADEVSRAVGEMDLGLPWTRALAGLVERTDVPALRRLTVALGRSQRLGTSVGSTLRSVAEDLRADRRARAEEAARRAPVKMLFPLVFLVLPAFLLLTVGPVVLATVRSLR